MQRMYGKPVDKTELSISNLFIKTPRLFSTQEMHSDEIHFGSRVLGVGLG